MTKTYRPDPSGADLAIDPEWTTRLLVRFIKDEVGRTGKRGVVVGLSGGLDSAVATHLAVRALGRGAVTCLQMPYRNSSAASIRDAEEVAKQLGTPVERIDITSMVDGFEKITGDVDRLRLGNVMARSRMILLFDRSARHDAIVLGTSNKTELLLGYGTLHGDMASGLNPIGDLYKTQVRQLAEYLDVPESVRSKPPSADLWPDQSDEEDLGVDYGTLDGILVLLIDARASRATALDRGFAPELIDRVTRLVVRSQFKRRPPLIAKVSLRSVGWDFRYPRDWMT